LLIAIGKTRATLHAQVVNQLFSIIAVLSAAPHGISAVAAVAIVVSAVHAATWLYFLRTVVRLSARDLAAVASTACLVTALALALPVLFFIFGRELPPLPFVVLGAAGLGIGWFAGVFIIRHPIADEILGLVPRLRLAASARFAKRRAAAGAAEPLAQAPPDRVTSGA
jgi:hypothetical protein